MACFSGPEIVNSGLRLLLDSSNNKSYSGSGSSWNDLVRNTSYNDTLNTGAGSEAWMGSASTGITVSVVLTKINTFVGYAEQPISKWSGTTDASFVLYHFGTTAGANMVDRIAWYGNRGGVWNTICDSFIATNNKTYAMTLQYSDLLGGQLWLNGVKVGSRRGGGARANSTSQLKIAGPVGTSSSTVKSCYIWDRELSDVEILQNFESVRSRYSL